MVLSLSVILECILVITGVEIAVGHGQKQSSSSHWDMVCGFTCRTSSWILAAAVLAGEILLSRPLMTPGVDPIAASAGRVAIAAVALVSVYEFFSRGI